MRILLLEDTQTDANLVIHMLKKVYPDVIIHHAKTVHEARKLLKNDFDLALLDMKLPDGNGIEILKEIRQTLKDMAVAMLTGSGDEELAVTALKAGANDYMVKTADYTDCLEQTVEFAIKNHLENSQRSLSEINLIYIEHNPSDIDLTQRHLTRYAPFIVLKNAQSGEIALELLPKEKDPSIPCKCDVIVIDYQLPGLNALEFIKIIRQERKLDIPIILVTGQGNEEVAVQALKLGANDYLVKGENYLLRLPSLILNAFQHAELEKKQLEIAASEEKYRLLAKNSGDVIFTLDFDLNYTFVSPAIYSLRGYTPEEIINRNISNILTPNSFNKVKEIYTELIPAIKEENTSVEPKVVELEAYNKDGRTIWIEVKLSLATDENGAAKGIIGVSRDISERKEAQRELKKLSRAVSQSPESIVITNKEGTIEYVNPKFTENTGYTKDEVIHENPRILTSGIQSKSFYKNLWDTIIAGKDWHGEFLNKKKNGELYWEKASISPLVNDDGEITHFVAVKEDITEKKKILDDLIIAKEKAEESNRLKTAFLNNMSHEIRTPLNGITGFLGLLQDSEIDDEAKQKYFDIINKSSARLIATVNDIMNISKIEAGLVKVSKTEVLINEILEEQYNFFLHQTESKGLKLIYKQGLSDSEARFVTDKQKLEGILTNLIKNAIKFTEQGEITFAYSLKKEKDLEVLEFHVKDTGVGIPANRLDAIFNRFEQADIEDTKAFEGSGLGLAIAKSYVEMLGGKIRVKSEVGEGSTFTFSIPYTKQFVKANDAKENLKKEANIALSNLSVIIAEDDETSKMLFEAFFKDFIYNIKYTKTGKETVELCRKNPETDLIIMDIKMPEMNGYDATREIRKFNNDVKIIAQTAFGSAGDREKAIESGCNDYITKPIKKELLIEKIRMCLNKKASNMLHK